MATAGSSSKQAVSFKDHFSRQSDGYARYRPRYPAALFADLARAAPGTELAWDCATGSGQAAVALAEHFALVAASDASPAQLARAQPHPRVAYLAATSEQVPLAGGCVDLTVIAQALHWFDLDAFYAEVKRVLRPGGLIAALAYGLHKISPSVDAVIDRLYTDIVGPYWPEERRHIDAGYASLPFPFGPVALGSYAMTANWSLSQLLGYLRTWSAVQRYADARGEDSVALIEPELQSAWGVQPEQQVVWPLIVRCGRI
jgi:SAM-dependent methyltransferase